MSMDMSDVLFDPDLITLFQLVAFVSGSRDDDGTYTATYAAPVDVTESIQPSTSSDVLMFLPEGERAKNAVTIYSKTQIQMGNGVDRESDQVIWNGQTYRVAFSQLWKAYGYWFVMATQVSPQVVPTAPPSQE